MQRYICIRTRPSDSKNSGHDSRESTINYIFVTLYDYNTLQRSACKTRVSSVEPGKSSNKIELPM